MENEKILSMLGLARRAGKLEGGYDLSVEKIKAGKAVLAFAARDISDKTYKNLKYETDKAQKPILRIDTDMEQLGRACGIKAGVAVITDEGFAKAVMELAEGKNQKEECII